jgi:ribosomal protein S18 acetylase RimI-like enzyme
MSAVSVRRARIEDAGALVSLFAELADGRESAEAPADPTSVLAGVLSQEGRELLVAELGDRIVGTADVLIVANLTHQAKPWAIVENVVVTESSRGQGIGQALMGRVLEIASAAGCYKVQLLSRKERADAHRFYEQLGFAAAAEGFRYYFL